MVMESVITKEQLDALSKETQKEYSKLDGFEDKYLLQVNGAEIMNGEKKFVYKLADVHGMVTTMEKHKESTRLLKPFKDADGKLIDPEAARKAIKTVADFASNPPEEKIKVALKAKDDEWQSKYDKDIKEKNDRIAAQDIEIDDETVGGAVRESIRKFGGIPRLLEPHVRRVAIGEKDEEGKRHYFVVDTKGTKRISTKSGESGFMGLDEYVESLQKDEELGLAFKPTASGPEEKLAQQQALRQRAGGTKYIKRTDQDAIDAHTEEIGKGTVVVID